MSDIPPSEPVEAPTPQSIMIDKLVDNEEPDAEDRLILKQFLWNNPTTRLANQIRNVFPDIQEEIVADCQGYDTTTDEAYMVQGEASEEVTEQAEGLNRGEWWVARFVGDWIVDPANGAVNVPTAREVANRHFRIRHGCES